MSAETKYMVIYLFSACDIYSYTWKDTSILSIGSIFIKHSNGSRLPYDIPFVLDSDFEAHKSVRKS